MNEQVFISADRHLAAFLLSRDFVIEKISENTDRKVEYTFTNTDVLTRAISEYKQDIALQSYKSGLLRENKLFRDFKYKQRRARKSSSQAQD